MLASYPWSALLIPLLFGLALWAGNRLAILALLKPRQFIGLRPVFGWRGWIPARAQRLAPALVQRILDDVVTVPELFRVIDKQRLAEHLTSTTQPRVAQLVEHIMLDQQTVLWDQLPAERRRRIVHDIQQQLPDTISAFLNDLENHIDRLMDMEWLSQRFLVQDPAPLCWLVNEVGHREFRLITRLGLRLGILTGLLPMTLVLLEAPAWSYVAAGLGAGLVTNQLARLAVFFPRSTYQWQGLTWNKGSFFRHQHESALAATRMLLREVASVRNFATTLFEGSAREQTRQLARQHVAPLIRRAMNEEGEFLRGLLSSEEAYQQLLDGLIERTIDVAREPFDDPTFNVERQIAAEQQLVWRVRSLSAEQYEALIRPVIRSGEWLLVLTGGVIGALLGLSLDELAAL